MVTVERGERGGERERERESERERAKERERGREMVCAGAAFVPRGQQHPRHGQHKRRRRGGGGGGVGLRRDLGEGTIAGPP